MTVVQTNDNIRGHRRIVFSLLGTGGATRDCSTD